MKLDDMLAPLTRGEFLEKHFRTRQLRVERGLYRGVAEDKLGWHTANRILGNYRAIAPGTVDVGLTRNRASEVRVILDKQSDVQLTFNDTIISSRVASHYFDPESLAAAMKRGAAVIVNDAHVLDDDLRALTCAVEDFANARAFCNLYITSTREPRLPPHLDAHDLFVVVLAGREAWHLHELHQPDAQRNLNAGQPGFEPGPIVETLVLEPGDLLYVPLGLARSVTTEAHSLRLNIGFTPPIRERHNGGRVPRFQFDLPRELD